jgi:hypothetical protein
VLFVDKSEESSLDTFWSELFEDASGNRQTHLHYCGFGRFSRTVSRLLLKVEGGGFPRF